MCECIDDREIDRCGEYTKQNVMWRARYVCGGKRSREEEEPKSEPGSQREARQTKQSEERNDQRKEGVLSIIFMNKGKMEKKKTHTTRDSWLVVM